MFSEWEFCAFGSSRIKESKSLGGLDVSLVSSVNGFIVSAVVVVDANCLWRRVRLKSTNPPDEDTLVRLR